MAKIQIIAFILIVAIFGVIFYVTESSNVTKNSALQSVPTLPPQADTFQPLTSQLNQQSQQGQQLSAEQQQQQQAQAQQQPQAQQQVQGASDVQGPLAASVSAVIKTSKGDIDVTLFGKDAPNTVRNFISKAESNYYNNLTFHRVEDWVIQGGDPKGDGTGGGQMAAEQTTAPFVVGSIGVARGSNPQINNDSQFFITKSASDWLNGQYTNFGIVTSGMDVVNKIKIGDKITGITVAQ